MGGKFHLRLNIGERPIANKYREGKVQRTPKGESKVLEIVKREAIGTSGCFVLNQLGIGGSGGRTRSPWWLPLGFWRLSITDALGDGTCQHRLVAR